MIELTLSALSDLEALGVALPESTASARDVYAEAVRIASLQPADDLRAAIKTGTVTPANVGELVNVNALALAARQHAHQLIRDLELTFHKAIKAGLRDDAARLHRELAANYAPAASVVSASAEHFGPDTTAAEVIGGKPEGIKLWKAVGAATDTLDRVSAAYRWLLSDALGELPAQMVSLFVTGGDIDHAAELYPSPNRWLRLAHAGYKLTLNSPTEAAGIVAKAEAAKANAVDAERAAHNAEHARMHMPIGLGR